MKTESLSIDLLTIDGNTQARVSIHEDTVEEYADIILEAGKVWPFDPLDVFTDGNRYLVADGFHRTLAAQKAGRGSIPCRVHKGTGKDAKIFGMTANDRHGLRMSRADKRHCVEWLLDNGGKMTQENIAVTAGVSLRTVKYIVAERKSEKVQIAPFEEKKPANQVPQKSAAAAESESTDGPHDAEEFGTTLAGEDGRTDSDGTESEESPPGRGGSAGTDRVDSDEWRLARSKAKKTAEALMRALGDLNDVRKISFLNQSLDDCRAIINELDAMK